MEGCVGTGIQTQGVIKMMIWICPECHYKNEEEDWGCSDFRCENCSRLIDEKQVKKSYWEVKPENFRPPPAIGADLRHIC